MLNIVYSKKSTKYLKRCDKKQAKRILDKIEELSINPFPKDCKRVQGKKDKTFRIRVGDDRCV